MTDDLDTAVKIVRDAHRDEQPVTHGSDTLAQSAQALRETHGLDNKVARPTERGKARAEMRERRLRHVYVPLASTAIAAVLFSGGVAIKHSVDEHIKADHANYTLSLQGDDEVSVMGVPIPNRGNKIDIGIIDGEPLPFAFGPDFEAIFQNVDITMPNGDKLENVNLKSDAFHAYYTQAGDTMNEIAKKEIESGNVFNPDGSTAESTNDNILVLSKAMIQLNGNTDRIDAGETILIPDVLGDV